MYDTSLWLGGKEYKSRLIVGTGKYPSFENMREAIEASGAELPPPELLPAAELIRAGLAGLVLWWAENPDLPRRDLVAAAERILAPTLAG